MTNQGMCEICTYTVELLYNCYRMHVCVLTSPAVFMPELLYSMIVHGTCQDQLGVGELMKGKGVNLKTLLSL